MEIHKSFLVKTDQNPTAPQATIFKYILWDRFNGLTISDNEISQIASQCSTLAELAFEAISREKPTMAEGRLAQSAKDAIQKYFRLNYPQGL